MVRIDGEWKRQGWLHLRIVHRQSQSQNASLDTYRKITPAVRLGGLAHPMSLLTLICTCLFLCATVGILPSYDCSVVSKAHRYYMSVILLYRD